MCADHLLSCIFQIEVGEQRPFGKNTFKCETCQSTITVPPKLLQKIDFHVHFGSETPKLLRVEIHICIRGTGGAGQDVPPQYYLKCTDCGWIFPHEQLTL